jgi:hypothetical protein
MHRITSFCVRHPWLTLLVAFTAAVLGARSSLRNEVDLGLGVTLGADHAVVRELEAFLERFGGGYPVLIAYECERIEVCQSALDPVALEMADAVSRQLLRSSVVARVSSPATTRLLLSSDELGIDARRLVEDGAAVRDPSLRQLALAEPLWRRTLISEDGRAGAIAVELVSTEGRALTAVVADVEQAIAPYRGGGFRFHLVGEAVLWVAAHADSAASMLRVGVGTGAMLFLTLLFLLRSLPAVVASLATVGVAWACTMGLLPLLGWRLSELTNGAATVILVIGCADCVHFVAHFLEARLGSEDVSSALLATSRRVLAPCFLTTATSAGSFASFGAGGVHSLVQFGAVAAVGVSLAFLLTFTLLPALLRLLPARPRSRGHSAAWQDVLSRLADLGTRRARLVLCGALALAIVGAAGIPKLRVELSFVELWAPDHPVRRALDFVSENFQRPNRVEVELTIPAGVDAEDPMVLARLVEAQRAIEQVRGVGEARSIASLLLRAHRLLHPEDTAPDLPESDLAVGELMTLVSAGDPGAIDPWLTLDQRRLRISAEVEKQSSAELRRMVGEVKQCLHRALPPDWSFRLTGPVVVGTHWNAEFARSQVSIVSAASLIVFGLIGLYLRSLRWALLAMIPNAVALALLFGAMGHWGVPMDFGSAIVAPVAIGIAADDTIHFLTAYARERRSGHGPIDALRRAITGVGEAVIATSSALALGFLSMLASPFPSISSLGFMSALAISAATLADLIVLPALIASFAAVRSPLAALRGRSAATFPPPDSTPSASRTGRSS